MFVCNLNVKEDIIFVDCDNIVVLTQFHSGAHIPAITHKIIMFSHEYNNTYFVVTPMPCPLI